MKKVIIFICALSFTMILSVFAHSINEISAQIVDFKIQVNGDEISLTNPIVVIDNKTYIPVREAAEKMEMTVEWDNKNKTISISEQKLIPFETNNIWGYKNAKGEVVVQPQYVSANQFSEGRGLVRKARGQNGQYGFVDISGKEVIPCSFYTAYDFCDGVALVSLAETTGDSRWTYIDMNGERLFEKEFVLARNFSQGYAAVLKEGSAAPTPLGNGNQKWSYINKEGAYVTELTFEEAYYFKDSYAVVKNNGKYGVINDKFEVVVDYQYDKTEEVKNVLKTINSKS